MSALRLRRNAATPLHQSIDEFAGPSDHEFRGRAPLFSETETGIRAVSCRCISIELATGDPLAS